MSMVPGLVPYLIYPKKRDSKSIAKNLAVRLYNTMASYEGAYRTQLGSPDFQLTQFITKIKLYVQVTSYLELIYCLLHSERQCSIVYIFSCKEPQ